MKGFYMENNLPQNNKIKKEKKIDFIQKKDNTIHSLFEVEHFLCNFQKFINTVKFYKILK